MGVSSSVMGLWKLHEKSYLSIVIIQVTLLCLLDVGYSKTLVSCFFFFFFSLMISHLSSSYHQSFLEERSKPSDYHSYPPTYFDNHACLFSGD